jgi:signal transduction histidine kinase
VSKSSPAPPHDSQQALALSIARAVQHGLPGKDSEEAIQASVRETLTAEARRNEQLLAILRCLLIAGILMGSAVAYFRPELISLAVLLGAPAFFVLGAWLAAATALAILLNRGWYRQWLRRALPAADAISITAVFLLLHWSVSESGLGAPTGLYLAGAVSCTFLAFSGALRLSRSSARLATILALVSWAVIWALSRVSVFTGAFTACLIVGIGVLGSRVTRIIRRVITEEVTRLRLVRLYREAQEAIDAREEVLRIVSHDLRNPLGTISMATDLLLEEHPDNNELTRYLGIIKRQGEGMRHLVNDLLDAARLESGRLPIHPEPIEVDRLLDTATEMMGPLAKDHRLTLNVSRSAELPAVHADPHRVNQVFSNLVGNAIKFTPPDGRITISAAIDGEKVRFSVADTGPGIPQEQLPEVFRRMWQARSDDARGIGLGLTIARAIVEAHGQTIGVESRLGEGTEFWFTLAATSVTESKSLSEDPPGVPAFSG